MTALKRWTRRQFAVPAEELAPSLIGHLLVRVLPSGERVSGRIVETEAYVAPDDLASHAARGRRTHRNRHMYDRPGTAYVYFTYGMHHCFNVVCGRLNEPVAVLVRAMQPLEGIEAVRALREAGAGRPVRDADLLRGPGRIGQGLALSLDDSGTDLVESDRLWIERSRWSPPSGQRVVSGPRVGITAPEPWTSVPLRWFVDGSPFVSRRPTPASPKLTNTQVARGG